MKKTIKSLFSFLFKILIGCLLFEFRQLLHFWLTMPQTAMTAEELYREFSKHHPADILYGPFQTDFFWALLVSLIVFAIFHGKDFSLKRAKQVAHISKEYWLKLIYQIIAVAVVLLVMLLIGPGRIAEAVVPEDIYFRLSGAGALRNLSGEAGDILQAIISRFYAHAMFTESELFGLAQVYIIYKLMRVLFDKKIPMKTDLTKSESK